jgi:polyhydroxyalkanoate synthase
MASLTELLRPNELAARVVGDVQRSMKRTRNGLKHLAGIDHVRVGLTPKDTVWQRGKAQLWRYKGDEAPTVKPPVLLVMSLVSRSYVLDLRPDNSLVRYLLGRGFDVYLLDWGVPDESDSLNTLETYTDDLLPAAVSAVCETSGVDDVTMWGYCFGGLLSVLSVAGNPDMPVRNLLVMATPTDFRFMGPMTNLVQEGRVDPETLLDDTGNVPADAIKTSFKMLRPTGDLTNLANLWQNLWNDEYLGAHQAMDRWANDHIPFPGATFCQTTELFARSNLLATGTVPLGGRTVALADIDVPFLSVVAEADHICPIDSAAPLIGLVGSPDKAELRLPAGHVGLIVGKSAHRKTLPAMADWVRDRSDPA